MSATLILGGIVLAVIAGIAVIAYAFGKKSEKAKGAAETAEIREKQLEAANERPRDKGELVKVLRERGL